MRWLAGSFWRCGRAARVGHALCAIALLSQLLGMQLVAQASATPLPAGVICHAGGDAAPAPDQAPSHQHADCALCPVCLAGSLQALGPASPPVLAPVMASAAAPLPPTRAGLHLGLARLAPQARAPPTSV